MIGYAPNLPLLPLELQRAKIIGYVYRLIAACVAQNIFGWRALKALGQDIGDKGAAIKKIYEAERDNCQLFKGEIKQLTIPLKNIIAIYNATPNSGAAQRAVSQLTSRQRMEILSNHWKQIIFEHELSNLRSNHPELDNDLRKKVIYFLQTTNQLAALFSDCDLSTTENLHLVPPLVAVLHNLGEINLLASLLEKLFASAQVADCWDSNYSYLSLQFFLPEILPTLAEALPAFGQPTAIRLIFQASAEQGYPEYLDGPLLAAGFVHAGNLGDFSSVPLVNLLLRAGKIFRSMQAGQDPLAAFFVFWPELKNSDATVKRRVCSQLQATAGNCYANLRSLIDEALKIGDNDARAVQCIAFKQLLVEKGIDNPVLAARLDDLNYTDLADGLLRISRKDSAILELAHLLENAAEIKLLEDYLTRNKKVLIDALSDNRNPRAQVVAIIALKLLGENNYHFAETLAWLLQNETLPENVRGLIQQICKPVMERRLAHYITECGSMAAIPGKVREWARTVAERAHFAHAKIREIARATNRPTITVYLLTTGHGLNAERQLDYFFTKPATRRRLFHYLVARSNISRYQELYRTYLYANPPIQLEIEMQVIVQSFNEQAERYRQGYRCSPEAAKIAVAKNWQARRLLGYYTLPVEFKVPSNGALPISSDSVEKLRALSDLAAREGCNLVIIDDSTLREAGLKSPNDAEGFEHGRAIARALSVINESLTGQATDVTWLTKRNNWQLPNLSAAAVHLFGLNTYDRTIYDLHVGGRFRKPEWLPTDDQHTIMGVEYRGSEVEPHQAFVIEDGQPKFMHEIFWTEFQQDIGRRDNRPAPFPLYRQILFVCRANHHRSSSSEYLARQLYKERFGEAAAEQVAFASAGLDADEYLRSEPTRGIMSQRARKMLAQRGVPVSEMEQSNKRQLQPQVVAWADLIFVFEQNQKADLLARYPEAAGRVFLLKDWVEAPGNPEIPTPRHFDQALRQMLETHLNDMIDRMLAR